MTIVRSLNNCAQMFYLKYDITNYTSVLNTCVEWSGNSGISFDISKGQTLQMKNGSQIQQTANF